MVASLLPHVSMWAPSAPDGDPTVNSVLALSDAPLNFVSNLLSPQPLTQPRSYTATMPKIMVVEDEPALVDALEYGLTAEGFEVIATSDGGQALGMFDRERPDLILLDLMLPGMSGTEVCKRI